MSEGHRRHYAATKFTYRTDRQKGENTDGVVRVRILDNFRCGAGQEAEIPDGLGQWVI